MELVQLAGYLAVFLMFSTFYMKKMIPLRAVGICANVSFIIFAGTSGVWPLFMLHICLLPLNISRMVQMIKLVNRVKEATKAELSMEFLIPHMRRLFLKEGDVVFTKGERADKLYLLREGTVRLAGFDVTLGEGEIFGEIGIFSLENKRMDTLICETDSEFLYIDDTEMLKLYKKNPEFGIYLVQLIIRRLNDDVSFRSRSKALTGGV